MVPPLARVRGIRLLIAGEGRLHCHTKLRLSSFLAGGGWAAVYPRGEHTLLIAIEGIAGDWPP